MAKKTKKPAAKKDVKKSSGKTPAKPAKKIAAKPAVTAKKAAAPAKKEAPVKKPIVTAKAAPAKSVATQKATSGKQVGASATPAKPTSTKIERPVPAFLDDLPDTPVQHQSQSQQRTAHLSSSDLFNDEEMTFFLQLLKKEKDKLIEKAKAAVEHGNIAIDKDEMFDEVDLASATIEQNLTFRLLDRDRKLLNEIEHAIGKIHTGEYGYCEGTGEAIPKRRLELRPWTRHSVKYKEQLERMKKSGRGVVDEDEIA